MTAKLRIDLSQGILEVEGDASLVESVYRDFRDRLVSAASGKPLAGDRSTPPLAIELDAEEVPAANEGTKKRSPKRRTVSRKAGGSSPAQGPYSPSLQRNLEIGGLDEFFGAYSPRNNSEKILIFAKFLEDSGLSITADNIYTCFATADPKNLPKVYPQALIDTRGKNNGFIDYDSISGDIGITALGQRHLLAKIGRKEAAE